MSRAWHTPTDLPTSYNCWQVQIPDDEQSEACFRYALMELAKIWNWESVGGISAEVCAALFFDGIEDSLDMVACEEGSDGMITGTVFWFAGSSAPDGSLVCDGDSLETSVYAELFAEIGYEFGGSGSVFNLPDLVNAFVVGAGDSHALADEGGEETHQLSVAELASHTHGIYKENASGAPTWTLASTKTIGAYHQSDNSGSNQAHNNLPPFVALLPCIAT